MSKKRLVSLISFENEEFVFPGVHHSYRFCLLTIGIHTGPIEMAFFLRQAGQQNDVDRRFNVDPDDIDIINPQTRNAPTFRGRKDADLAISLYRRVPTFGTCKNPPLLIQNFFSSSNKDDQTSFEKGAEANLEARAKVVRGTMIDQFESRAASHIGANGEYRALLPEELSDASFQTDSDKHVTIVALRAKLDQRQWQKGWLLGWRDITSSHVNRTVISAIFPIDATDDTVSLILFREDEAQASALCVANLNTLILDYLARQKVGGIHLRKYVLEQLPSLPRSAYRETDLGFIVSRVLELSYTSHAMAHFARDLGCDGAPFAWDEDRRAQLRAELDAWYALAYGLSRDELRYVLDPKDVMGADYPSETFRVLQNNELKKYGEYRTRRLVLAAYDKLAISGPETRSVADGQWQGTIGDEMDVRLLLAAIVKRMRHPRSLREVTMAFLYAAQPHLLTPRLDGAARIEWQRLVGDAAALQVSQAVTPMSSGRLAFFGAARGWLASRLAWRYDAITAKVDRGASIYDIMIPPWAEGRADFAWHAVGSLNSDAVFATLSQEEQTFIAQAAAA